MSRSHLELVLVAAGMRVVGVATGNNVLQGLPENRTSIGAALVDTVSEIATAVAALETRGPFTLSTSSPVVPPTTSPSTPRPLAPSTSMVCRGLTSTAAVPRCSTTRPWPASCLPVAPLVPAIARPLIVPEATAAFPSHRANHFRSLDQPYQLPPSGVAAMTGICRVGSGGRCQRASEGRMQPIPEELVPRSHERLGNL